MTLVQESPDVNGEAFSLSDIEAAVERMAEGVVENIVDFARDPRGDGFKAAFVFGDEVHERAYRRVLDKFDERKSEDVALAGVELHLQDLDGNRLPIDDTEPPLASTYWLVGVLTRDTRGLFQRMFAKSVTT